MSLSKTGSLGISPYVQKGMRGWRVTWRVPLASPNRQRTKSDSVRTRHFPISDNVNEEQAYAMAVACAKQVYPGYLVSDVAPFIDWDQLAKSVGETFRDQYVRRKVHTSLGKAKKLFAAGMEDESVATALGIHRTTAMRWRRKLIKEGELDTP